MPPSDLDRRSGDPRRINDALNDDERYRLGRVEGELESFKEWRHRHEQEHLDIKVTLKNQDERTERLHRENKETSAASHKDLSDKLQILIDDKNKKIGADQERAIVTTKRDKGWGRVLAIGAALATLLAVPLAWALDKISVRIGG